MRLVVAIVFLININLATAQQFTIQTTEMSPMPEAVSNNAVCEGFIGETPYVYSFCGIDSTKTNSGIHLKSFRYNTQTDNWETIANVPDTLGKIAASASRVGNIIYVIGGYHVLANGNEISSKSVHRYNTQNNSWLTDGAPLPIAIDDQVQAVYNDSLIYVITGWSNSNNVTAVQIYDTYSNTWQTGTPIPNTSTSRLFGGSGTVIGNTIYYYGGAKNSTFSANNTLTIGKVNSADPTQIVWSDTILDTSIKAYRSVCTTIWKTATWLGGADITYNFNGIAYNGSGGVSPNNRFFWLNDTDISFGTDVVTLPMDLRGIANTSLFTKYLVGGMENNQKVSKKTIKINFTDITGLLKNETTSKHLKVYPNPAKETVYFEFISPYLKAIELTLFNVNGQIIMTKHISSNSLKINSSSLKSGMYFYHVTFENALPIAGKLIIN